MKCENEYCVYWKNNRCILDEISLDILGACKCCIYVDIDNDVLEQYRKKQLDRYDKQG